MTSLQALATLRGLGWQRNVSGGPPQGPDGASVPWLSYSAVRFLESLRTSDSTVLEFGSGGSTRWLSARFAAILAVEHDREWFELQEQPANGALVLRECDGDWFNTKLPSPYLDVADDDSPWDVVIVDGMARQTCSEQVGRFVRPGGLVVLNDTHLSESIGAQEALHQMGLGRIDFWGFKPGIGIDTCTSVYSTDFDSWVGARDRV